MRIRTRWRRLFGPDPQTDVERELGFHLEMRVRELVARGVSPEDARAEALRRFGHYDGPRQECVAITERRSRRMTRTDYLKALKQDVAYAFRMLRRAPTFTVVAVSTLALGIGANSAIFSVVQGVVLQSLPYRDAEQLYRVRTLYPDGTPYSVSAADFMSLRRDSRSLDQIEAYGGAALTLTGQGEPIEVQGAQVSDGLFQLLGLDMAAGRALQPDDHGPGSGGVVILAHGFWRRQFGGDAAAIGRSLTIAGRSMTIVGVAGPDARLPLEADMFAPLPYDETFDADTANARRAEFLAVIGHARPGVTATHVEEDLRTVGATLETAFPQTNTGLTFTATPLRDLVIGDVRTPLLMLLGAVGFVLLVACANVANLLLARASARQDEIAVRAALGAGRGRLLRQLITESLVLGAIGGLTGLALAYAATRALVAAQPGNIPRLEDVGVNAPVVLFTLAIAIATSLLFGVLPALQATGRPLTEALRQGGRGGGSGVAGHRARAVLVVAEMALAVVLLTGAGLLLRSFAGLTQPLGSVHLDDGVAFRVTMEGPGYARPQQMRARVQELEARLSALPGVTGVATTTVLPLAGRGSMVGFAVEGAPPPPPDVNAEIGIGSATPAYFEAIGMRIVRGRGFTDRDDSEAPGVAVINEAAVRRWFPGQDPIGRFVAAGSARREVVGVIGDVAQRDRRQAVVPHLFAPYAQRPARTVRVVVRAQGDPLGHSGSIRSAVRELDPGLAVVSLMPLTQLVDDSVARPRFYTSLLTLFAGVALTLAATGMFGVMSYAVAQRTREISIRIALGAPSASVLWMMLARALGLAGAGAALGLLAALALGRVIQDQLYGVTLLDPLTLTGVIGVLMLSAILSGVLPARRAANVHPANALRQG